MKTLVSFIAIFALSSNLFAQDLEKRLAEIDPRVYAPGSVEAKNAPLLLGKFLKAQRDRVNLEDVKAWQSIADANDRDNWEKSGRDWRIANLKKSVGSLPALTANVPVHIGKSLPGDGFAIDNLVYESRPGLWVTANLYRSVPLPKSAPGILIIHSHHNGKSQGELQDMGMMWARAGCYVLIPDQLGHNERRQHPFVDDKSFPQPFKVGRQDYYFRYNLGVQLHLVGESLIGWMANDMIAGVTLVLKQPNVDPARIILLGSVAGGGDPAAVTAALDKRIQCLVPFNFGGPQPETRFPLPADADKTFDYMGSGSWESTRNLADSAPGGFLPWAIVASIAPRHLIHAHEFAWDGDCDPVWKRYKKIWSWYGADDKLAAAHGRGSVSGKAPDSTHCNNIGPEHRAMFHPLFKKWFGIDVPKEEYKKRLPTADLVCWTPELKERLKPRMVHELAREIWEKRRPARTDEIPIRFLQAYFGGKLASQKEESKFSVRAHFGELKDSAKAIADRTDEPVGGISVRRVVLRGGNLGLEIPLVILEPAENKSPGRIVVAYSQAGKRAFMSERRPEIAGLLRAGIAVCLPDLVGTGETAVRGESRGRTSGATSMSSTMQMLGNSIPAMQIDSLSQVLRFLNYDAIKRSQRLRFCLWSESFAKTNGPNSETAVPYDADPTPMLAEPMGLLSLAMLPAKGFNDLMGILTRGELMRFGSVLNGPFLHVPHSISGMPILPQVETEDFVMFLLQTAKENKGEFAPLRMEGMVDGLNRPATQAEIDRSFARVRREFGQTDRFTQLAERSAAGEVVRWFVKCFE